MVIVVYGMANVLIVLHVLTGMGGSLLPIWIAMEMAKPFNEISRRDIRLASAAVLILIIVSWVTGGIYYVDVYGSQVKPAIKASQPWIHDILMESKEHVFLFMPFLALLLNSLVFGNFENKKRFVAEIAIALAILGLFVAVAGFAITGARAAAGVVV